MGTRRKREKAVVVRAVVEFHIDASDVRNFADGDAGRELLDASVKVKDGAFGNMVYGVITEILPQRERLSEPAPHVAAPNSPFVRKMR